MLKFFPHTLRPLITIVLLGALVGSVEADIFRLKSGGEIRGQWLNRDESPRTTYRVQTDSGATITLDRERVLRVVPQSEAELQYDRVVPTVPDTVEGHWKLAEWCLEHRLSVQRKTHLRRIIELDSDHAEARRLLGYRKTGSRWMTRDEEMASKGLRLYAGRYRTTQEIELLEREKKDRLAQREWHGRIKRWRGWLETDKSGQAVAGFRSIRDPYAVPALVKFLEEEQHRQVKLVYVETLARIGSPEAIKILATTSLTDIDQEVRLTCLDHIVEGEHPEILGLYTGALRSKDNIEVRRAAVALRAIDNPNAILPLIEALTTQHKYKVVSGNPGQMRSTFNRDGGGGGGLSFGGNGPKIIRRTLQNPEVRTALIALADGVNFDYDKKAWRAWYFAQKKSSAGGTRRD